MDQSKFGILAYNKLRIHNLVSMAHMSNRWVRSKESVWISESAHKFQKSTIYWQQTKEKYQMAAISKL